MTIKIYNIKNKHDINLGEKNYTFKYKKSQFWAQHTGFLILMPKMPLIWVNKINRAVACIRPVITCQLKSKIYK